MLNFKGNFRDLAVPRGGPQASEINVLGTQKFGEPDAAGRPNPQDNSQIVPVYEARLERKKAAALHREAYYTRRRHALHRVRKALHKASATLRLALATPPDLECVELDVWVRVPGEADRTGFIPSVNLKLRVPFDMPTPDIVRLLQVRAKLAHANRNRTRV